MTVAPPRIELIVAPVGGDGRRLMEARAGDVLHRDTLNINSATSRRRFMRDLAGKLGIGPEAISHLDDELIAKADAADAEAERIAAESADATAAVPAEHDNDVRPVSIPEPLRDEALAMLEAPDLMKRIVDDVAALGVAGERETAAMLYLCGVSRLLSRPLAIIVQGPTSSGKSYVPERVAALFPPEAVIHATQMTPQALFHMRPGSLAHRWIVAGERSRAENDDTAEATRALREMLSAGKLCKLMPMKVGGEIVTQCIEQAGPIAYVETTTLSSIFDEDLNRCLLLHSDEQPEQTRRILARQAQVYAGNAAADVQHVIDRHHAVQRLLSPLQVVIPYAERLAERIASDRVEVRRAFPLLMSAVQASALLHQRQRSLDEHGRLIAEADDYKLVRHLLAKPMTRTLGGGLSEPARRFYERLRSWVSGPFSTTEVKRHEAGSDRAAYGWLVECQRFGLLDVVEPSRGPKPATWKLVADAPDPTGCAALPSCEELFGAGMTCTLARKAQVQGAAES